MCCQSDWYDHRATEIGFLKEPGAQLISNVGYRGDFADSPWAPGSGFVGACCMHTAARAYANEMLMRLDKCLDENLSLIIFVKLRSRF